MNCGSSSSCTSWKMCHGDSVKKCMLLLRTTYPKHPDFHGPGLYDLEGHLLTLLFSFYQHQLNLEPVQDTLGAETTTHSPKPLPSPGRVTSPCPPASLAVTCGQAAVFWAVDCETGPVHPVGPDGALLPLGAVMDK